MRLRWLTPQSWHPVKVESRRVWQCRGGDGESDGEGDDESEGEGEVRLMTVRVGVVAVDDG